MQCIPEVFWTQEWGPKHWNSSRNTSLTLVSNHGGGFPNELLADIVFSADLSAGTALYLSTSRASFLSGRFVWSNWDMEQLETLKEKIVTGDLLKMAVGLGGDMLKSVVSLPK